MRVWHVVCVAVLLALLPACSAALTAARLGHRVALLERFGLQTSVPSPTSVVPDEFVIKKHKILVKKSEPVPCEESEKCWITTTFYMDAKGNVVDPPLGRSCKYNVHIVVPYESNPLSQQQQKMIADQQSKLAKQAAPKPVSHATKQSVLDSTKLGVLTNEAGIGTRTLNPGVPGKNPLEAVTSSVNAAPPTSRPEPSNTNEYGPNGVPATPDTPQKQKMVDKVQQAMDRWNNFHVTITMYKDPNAATGRDSVNRPACPDGDFMKPSGQDANIVMKKFHFSSAPKDNTQDPLFLDTVPSFRGGASKSDAYTDQDMARAVSVVSQAFVQAVSKGSGGGGPTTDNSYLTSSTSDSPDMSDLKFNSNTNAPVGYPGYLPTKKPSKLPAGALPNISG